MWKSTQLISEFSQNSQWIFQTPTLRNRISPVTRKLLMSHPNYHIFPNPSGPTMSNHCSSGFWPHVHSSEQFGSGCGHFSCTLVAKSAYRWDRASQETMVTGQSQPTACFYKSSVTGTQTYSFIYIFSTTAFELCLQSWTVATETICSPNDHSLTGPLKEMFANAWDTIFRMVDWSAVPRLPRKRYLHSSVKITNPTGS